MNYKTDPLVTVIVPNYNHARFLPERLRSLSEQTFRNFEIILLDDSSSDHSAELLKDFSRTEQRVSHVVINDINSGKPNAQWQRGLRLAAGKFIWIAESDDIADPSLLASLISAMQDNDSVGVAYTDSWLIDDTGNKIGRYDYSYPYYDSSQWDSDWVLCGEVIRNEYLVFRNLIPNASAVLFRKDALQNAIESSNHYKSFGDWFVYIKISLNYDFAFIAKPLNYYRIHHNTTRWYNPKSYKRAVKEKIDILNFFSTHISSSENLRKSISHITKNSDKYKKIHAFIKKIKAQLKGSERITIYALNDISGYVVSEINSNHKIINIIDERKFGMKYMDIKIISINNFNPQKSDTVIICSPSHATDMQSELIGKDFQGKIFIYED